jgi:hypothetical protein
MDRDEIKKRASDAAARYALTQDPQDRHEVVQVSFELAQFSYLDTLQEALERSRTTDVRTEQIYQAVTFLEDRAVDKWPFEQFRKALDNDEPDQRFQSLDSALIAIKHGILKT